MNLWGFMPFSQYVYVFSNYFLICCFNIRLRNYFVKFNIFGRDLFITNFYLSRHFQIDFKTIHFWKSIIWWAGGMYVLRESVKHVSCFTCYTLYLHILLRSESVCKACAENAHSGYCEVYYCGIYTLVNVHVKFLRAWVANNLRLWWMETTSLLVVHRYSSNLLDNISISNSMSSRQNMQNMFTFGIYKKKKCVPI